LLIAFLKKVKIFNVTDVHYFEDGGQNDNFCQSFEAKLEGYKHSFRKMDLHQYHHFFTQRLVVKSVAFSHLCLIIWQQGQLKIVQKCEKALLVFLP